MPKEEVENFAFQTQITQPTITLSIQTRKVYHRI